MTSRTACADHGADGWTSRFVGAPAFGTLAVARWTATTATRCMTATDYLTRPRWLAEIGRHRKR
jgi:hypothetical protein